MDTLKLKNGKEIQMKIQYIDTDGTKGSLPAGTLGYDAYAPGGDEGRVAVGTASGTDILLSKKDEVDAIEVRVVNLESQDSISMAIALG